MINSKRKGFTLVELLIVIVVIGVLSAMMMLSSTEAVTSAKAAKIISDMRVMKTAILEWYMDNMDRVGKYNNEYYVYTDKSKIGKSKGLYIGEFAKTKEGQAELQKYLGNSAYVNIGNTHEQDENWGKKNATGSYVIASETRGEVSQAVKAGTAKAKKLTGCSWYVGYCFGYSEGKLKEKIEARASSLGLTGGDKKDVEDICSNSSVGHIPYCKNNFTLAGSRICSTRGDSQSGI